MEIFYQNFFQYTRPGVLYRPPPPSSKFSLCDARKRKNKMADSEENNVIISSSFSAKLTKWRVTEGQDVKERTVLALYEKLDHSDDPKGFHLQPKLKCTVNGRIKKLLVQEGDVVPAG